MRDVVFLCALFSSPSLTELEINFQPPLFQSAQFFQLLFVFIVVTCVCPCSGQLKRSWFSSPGQNLH